MGHKPLTTSEVINSKKRALGARQAVDGLDVRGLQREVHGLQAVQDAGRLAGTRDGEDVIAFVEQPGKRDAVGRRGVLRGQPGQQGIGAQALVAEVAAHGAVGDVGHPTRLAEIHETVLEIPLRERITAVLDRGDGGVRERRLELPGVYVREADVPDSPFLFERDERPQRFPEIDRGVQGMELGRG